MLRPFTEDDVGLKFNYSTVWVCMCICVTVRTCMHVHVHNYLQKLTNQKLINPKANTQLFHSPRVNEAIVKRQNLETRKKIKWLNYRQHKKVG